ncbi:hypothetical protein NS14008_21965 [Nocardia seriolae]|nr:hypothetical protein NS14008_21965 [Nocardia seriolae]
MDGLAVRRWGDGPGVALVHGGAGPKTTWAGLDSLAERWTLLVVYRPGYPPSPPVHGNGQDFLVDAEDLAAVFGEYRPHVVAHSYGVLGTLLAAVGDPSSVRSLTLIEPPLYFVAAEDPGVARLRRLGDTVLTHGLDADPDVLREFLVLAGSPAIDPGPLPGAVAAAVRRAHHGRLPDQARPDLDALRTTGIPALVASGAHAPALERVCDARTGSVSSARSRAQPMKEVNGFGSAGTGRGLGARVADACWASARRSGISSLRSSEDTCLSTVRTEMNSRTPISALLRCSPTSSSTSASRVEISSVKAMESVCRMTAPHPVRNGTEWVLRGGFRSRHGCGRTPWGAKLNAHRVHRKRPDHQRIRTHDIREQA